MANYCKIFLSQVLMEITVKELPQKVLGSPAYQVANMDILNASILNVVQ